MKFEAEISVGEDSFVDGSSPGYSILIFDLQKLFAVQIVFMEDIVFILERIKILYSARMSLCKPTWVFWCSLIRYFQKRLHLVWQNCFYSYFTALFATF